MKRSFSIVLTGLILVGNTQAESADAVSTGTHSTYTVLGCAGLILGCYGLYKLFSFNLEEYITDQAAKDIVLMLTTNATLSQLPPKEREEAFKNKARLITIRKSVIEHLEKRIATSTMSTEHREQLTSKLNSAKVAFGVIDAVRTENPYEKDCELSFTDTHVVSKITDSIVLLFKPDQECTPNELELKKKNATRRDTIIKKVKSTLSCIWLDRVTKSLIAASYILQLV